MMEKKQGAVYQKPQELSFRRGLYRQMEYFKSSSSGNGDNNWDLMCDSVENLKSDLKSRMVSDGFEKDLKIVEGIIMWYRTLGIRYTRNTPDGPEFRPPVDLKIKLNKNLRSAYELLVRAMDKLGLLQ